MNSAITSIINEISKTQPNLANICGNAMANDVIIIIITLVITIASKIYITLTCGKQIDITAPTGTTTILYPTKLTKGFVDFIVIIAPVIAG